MPPPVGVRVPTPHWASSGLSPGRGRAPTCFPLACAVGLVGVASVPCASLEAAVPATRFRSCWAAPIVVLWLEALAFAEAFFRLCPLASGFPLAPGPRRTRQTGSSGEPHALRPRARGVAVSLHLPCPVPLYILRDLGVLRRRDGDSTSSSVRSSGRPPVVREAERLATAGPEHEGARQPLLPQTEGPHPGPGR